MNDGKVTSGNVTIARRRRFRRDWPATVAAAAAKVAKAAAALVVYAGVYTTVTFGRVWSLLPPPPPPMIARARVCDRVCDPIQAVAAMVIR